MKDIITAIQNKLAEIEQLHHTDQNWGQLNTSSPSVKFPCALIDIDSANYLDNGKDPNASPQNRQTSDILIELTIANIQLTGGSNLATDYQKEKALHIWEIIEAIHTKLQGYKPIEGTSVLIRKTLKKNQRTDCIQSYKIGYTTRLHNC